ncbi:MAG TPA: hypothetical protein VGF59_05715 [Bryobacteraceae bacterium]|jgi:hypothetical protein
MPKSPKEDSGKGGSPGPFTFEDIHRAAFGTRTPKERTLAELKDAIRRYIRQRHAC